MTAGKTDSETTTLASELRVILGQLIRRLREEARTGDLTLSQLFVLGRLDRDGPSTQTALARGEGVRPQSMAATIAGLQEAGLVVGTPDPSDGRQTIIQPTESAQAVIRAHRAAREGWLFQTIQSHLTEEERHQLEAALPLLRKLLET